MQAQTIDQSVANYVRSFREKHSLTLDQVARAARKYGAQWGAASVRSIEQAESALTLEKLIYLALAVRLLAPSDNHDGQPIPLKSLLGDAEAFQLGEDPELSPTIAREWLDGALSGKPLDPLDSSFKAPPGFEAAQFIARHPEKYEYPAGITAEQIFFAVPTGAEMRAAKKLGIEHPKKVSVWAQHLWGCTLDEEAANRAGEDSTPQARGRVTRLLTEELSEALLGSQNG